MGVFFPEEVVLSILSRRSLADGQKVLKTLPQPSLWPSTKGPLYKPQLLRVEPWLGLLICSTSAERGHLSSLVTRLNIVLFGLHFSGPTLNLYPPNLADFHVLFERCQVVAVKEDLLATCPNNPHPQSSRKFPQLSLRPQVRPALRKSEPCLASSPSCGALSCICTTTSSARSPRRHWKVQRARSCLRLFPYGAVSSLDPFRLRSALCCRDHILDVCSGPNFNSECS